MDIAVRVYRGGRRKERRLSATLESDVAGISRRLPWTTVLRACSFCFAVLGLACTQALARPSPSAGPTTFNHVPIDVDAPVVAGDGYSGLLSVEGGNAVVPSCARGECS